jgi:membrane protein DedA with SNARE-associated domain
MKRQIAEWSLIFFVKHVKTKCFLLFDVTPMAISKILTNERFFILTGGSLGFILCWLVAWLMDYGLEVAFEKATLGCVIGALILYSFSYFLNKVLKTLKRERIKQNETMTDKEED